MILKQYLNNMHLLKMVYRLLVMDQMLRYVRSATKNWITSMNWCPNKDSLRQFHLDIDQLQGKYRSWRLYIQTVNFFLTISFSKKLFLKVIFKTKMFFHQVSVESINSFLTNLTNFYTCKQLFTYYLHFFIQAKELIHDLYH